MSRPDVTNHSELRATPSRERTRAPTEGQLATYQTGPDRFFNLARRGSFRTWPLEGLFRTRRLDGVLASDGSPLYQDVIIDGTNFNCFAWSLGHTDRWIEGGSVEQMEELCASHYLGLAQRANS
jgi:hypothetical protein